MNKTECWRKHIHTLQNTVFSLKRVLVLPGYFFASISHGLRDLTYFGILEAEPWLELAVFIQVIVIPWTKSKICHNFYLFWCCSIRKEVQIKILCSALLLTISVVFHSSHCGLSGKLHTLCSCLVRVLNWFSFLPGRKPRGM